MDLEAGPGREDRCELEERTRIGEDVLEPAAGAGCLDNLIKFICKSAQIRSHIARARRFLHASAATSLVNPRRIP